MRHAPGTSRRWGLGTTIAALALATAVQATPAGAHPTDEGPIVLGGYRYFFVNGSYVEHERNQVMQGSMYVEHLTPAKVERKAPVVMIHGGGQTGTNFMGTPDGRRGWAHDFLRAGFEVYVVDQPGRARSGQFPELYGGYARTPVARVEQRFTAPEVSKLWPQAERHTQWPGSGRAGDPVFDQFYASQVPSIADGARIEELNQAAGVALLERIGPAVLLVHSQSGPFAWTLADARPDLVRAIVNIEPNGPPFREVEFKGAPEWFGYGEKVVRPWGPSRLRLTYEPAAATPEELGVVLEERPQGEGLVRCHLQAEPARQLPRLKGIPTLIVAAEASYHAAYDHCTSRYLRQAGVEHDFVRLPERGLSGNGHMIMIERNNHEVADYLIGWLTGKIS